MAAAFQLTATQLQTGPQVQLPGNSGKGAALDKGRAQPGELAFAGTREAFEQPLGDYHAEYRIAKKFQALVVARAGAAVGEGLDKQRLVGEVIAQPRR